MGYLCEPNIITWTFMRETKSLSEKRTCDDRSRDWSDVGS